MNLLSPLGLAATALGPVIVLLYMLKGSRQRRAVPSVMLWRGLTQQVTARKRWQRPPIEVLLVLQLLVVLLGSLALARPSIPHPTGKHLVVVIDASASMNSTDISGGTVSRFEAAKEMARQLVAVADTNWVTVVRGGTSPTVLASSPDASLAWHALQQSSPGGGEGALLEAIGLAATLLTERPSPHGEILVLSDGAYPPLTGLGSLPAPVRFVRLGTSGDNIGITKVTATRGLGGVGPPVGFVQLANYGSRAITAPLQLLADGMPIETRELRLGPQQKTGISMALPPQTTFFGVSIGRKDILALDNFAEAPVAGAEKRRALLVSSDPGPLGRALAAVPEQSLEVVSPQEFRDQTADIIAFDGSLPARLPRVPLLVIHPPRGTDLLNVRGEAHDVQATDFDQSSPLLKSVDLGAQRFSGVALVDVPPWATVVARAGHAPLVLAGQTEGRRVVIFCFDPVRSNLDKMAAFPLLVANTLDWLVGPAPGTKLRPGEPIMLPAGSGALGVEIEMPDGQVRRAETRGAMTVWRETETVGRYTVRTLEGRHETVSRHYVVNVESEQESDVRPAEHPELEAAPAPPVPYGQQYQELYSWLVLTVLALVLVEWWYFARHA